MCLSEIQAIANRPVSLSAYIIKLSAHKVSKAHFQKNGTKTTQYMCKINKRPHFQGSKKQIDETDFILGRTATSQPHGFMQCYIPRGRCRLDMTQRLTQKNKKSNLSVVKTHNHTSEEVLRLLYVVT